MSINGKHGHSQNWGHHPQLSVCLVKYTYLHGVNAQNYFADNYKT